MWIELSNSWYYLGLNVGGIFGGISGFVLTGGDALFALPPPNLFLSSFTLGEEESLSLSWALNEWVGFGAGVGRLALLERGAAVGASGGGIIGFAMLTLLGGWFVGAVGRAWGVGTGGGGGFPEKLNSRFTFGCDA